MVCHMSMASFLDGSSQSHTVYRGRSTQILPTGESKDRSRAPLLRHPGSCTPRSYSFPLRLEGGWREGGGVPRAPLWREQGAQVSETVPATASETWSLESRALLGPHVLTLAATPSPSPPASLPSWGLESQALRTVGAQGLQGAFPPLSGHFSTSLPSPGARGDSCVGDGITWGSSVSRCGLPHDAGEGASLRPRGHLPTGAVPCSQCHAGEQSWRRAVLHPPQGEHAQVRIPGRHRHGPEQGYRGPQGLQA